MTKTLTIRVKSLHEALEGFRTTFKAVAAGQRVARREGVYFASIEAARNLLTPTRLALLRVDRKSTRLNSSHQIISYAVFCLKKKKDVDEGEGGDDEAEGAVEDVPELD